MLADLGAYWFLIALVGVSVLIFVGLYEKSGDWKHALKTVLILWLCLIVLAALIAGVIWLVGGLIYGFN